MPATGRTRTFTAQAFLVLNACGGQFISGPDTGFPNAFDNGWLGSNFFHPNQQAGGALTGGNLLLSDPNSPFHSVTFSAFGASVILTTFRYDLSDIDPGFGGHAFNLQTHISAGGNQVKKWNSGPFEDVLTQGSFTYGGTIEQPPESLSINAIIQVSAEEWIDEIPSADVGFGSAFTNVRPISAYDPRMSIYWKPTTDVRVSVNGSASGSYTIPAPASLQSVADFSVSVTGATKEFYVPGMFPLATIQDRIGGLSDLPSGPYAAANGISMNGTLPDWEILIQTQPTQHTFNLTSYTFRNGLVAAGNAIATGSHAINAPIQGEIRDWNGPVYNIPISFSGGPSHKFSSSTIISTQPDPTVAPPAGYSSTDTKSALFRYGDPWTGLTLNRAKTLTVEAFSTIGGANGWAGTDCDTGPAYSGGELTVTASASGSPRLDKTLKSDYLDLMADPAVWWAAHRSGFSSAVNTWWDTTGDVSVTGSSHIGDWYRVGKRLLSGSDVFNWSSFRYADLTGYADSACTVTLEVTYDEIDFSDAFWTITANQTPLTVTYDINLTTSSAAHRIDLPSKAGQDGLRYVRSLRLTFPTGRTLHLQSFALVEAERPKIDVHLPSEDAGHLTATEHGKHCLFLSTRGTAKPNSVWGWPCLRKMTCDVGSGDILRYQSLTLSELATELSLQEGWTATAGPNADRYAVWLEEVFERPATAILTARKSFGAMLVYANFSASNPPLLMQANLGNAVFPLAFDPNTFLPVKVPVEADTLAPVVKDTAKTDEHGHARLELTTEEPYEIYAGKGTASETHGGVTTINRTMAFPRLTAAEAAGVGGVSLDIDRIGNVWVVYVPTAGENADKVTFARKLGSVGDWEYYPIVGGSEPYVKVAETDAESTIYVVFREGDDTIRLASNTSNGSGPWKMKTIATGVSPALLIDKSTGRILFSYYRGGSVYVKRSDDAGDTFLEAEYTVITGLTDPTLTPLDFDPDHAVILAYSDGTNVLTKTSTDNALTFL